MKRIFQKTFFSKAPGGDNYEWKDVETKFDKGETIGVIQNYEIEIHINETLFIH